VQNILKHRYAADLDSLSMAPAGVGGGAEGGGEEDGGEGGACDKDERFECSICTDRIDAGEEALTSDCCVSFWHKACFDQWRDSCHGVFRCPGCNGAAPGELVTRNQSERCNTAILKWVARGATDREPFLVASTELSGAFTLWFAASCVLGRITAEDVLWFLHIVWEVMKVVAWILVKIAENSSRK